MSTNIDTIHNALHALGTWATLQEITQAAGLNDLSEQQVLHPVQVLTGRGAIEKHRDAETGVPRWRAKGVDGSERAD